MQRLRVRFFVTLFAMLIVASVTANAQTRAQHNEVPYVGCKSDGQTGPTQAPSGHTKTVSLPSNIARRLAYYQSADGIGVLAPRGWNCFGTYGSSGSTLFVSPESIEVSDLFSSDWKGFGGAVIQVSYSYGDTSGRFTVARTIARVFPAYSSFVQRVQSEGIEPPSSFAAGPFAGDRLKYRSDRLVEFETPANSEGLGTQSRLTAANAPIQGVAILVGSEPNLLQLAMRLTPQTADLGASIIQQMESDTARR